MKNTNNHDRLLKRLVEDQIIAKLRHDEPADLRVTHGGIADTPPQFRMLARKSEVLRMVCRTRSATSGLSAAMWWEASSKSRAAFGLNLARIMTGGATHRWSWLDPDFPALRQAGVQAPASS